jgi:glycerol-3-phosphate acyltransferase PlsY
MIYAVMVGVAIIGYLLGSINTSIIYSKFKKTDIREHGSGNAGLTNTLRTFGKGAAVVVLLGDVLKGVIAILLARLACNIFTIDMANEASQIAGVAAILGHNFPVYYGFKGGKGVLTSVTVLMMIEYKLALCCLLIFVVIVAITRYVSLGSMLAAAAFVVMVLVIKRYDLLAFGIIVASMLIFRHRSNIKRLIQGNENKLGQKKKEANV